MALDRTAGFDMLVQISETELNTQIATAFLAGALFPSSMSVPVVSGAVVGTADVNFQTPTADLDRPRPRVGLTVPFVSSQLQLTAPAAATIAPLGGVITIIDAVEMITESGSQIATLDFRNGAPDVTVAFDAASQAVLAPFLAAAGMSLAQAQNLFANAVLAELQNGVGRLDLTPAIPVMDDGDPTTIFDIDVTTVNDTTAADRDCLAFGVRMANDSGGNVGGITTSFIPAGSPSVIMLSNFWLLARVMRPRVAAALGSVPADFDTPLRLNRSVPAPGGSGTLTSLEARVIGNRIRVDGRATASGTGWDAVSTFTFFIDIGLDSTGLTVTATTPTVDTDVDLAWWVWLVSLGLGGLFGGIVGVIVAAIALAVVEAVAEGVVNGIVSGGIGGSLGGLASVPLGPIGGSLALSSVVLDDLELRGSIVKNVSVPIRSHGERTVVAGLAFDLDTGTVRNTALPGSDLVWQPASGLSTNGAAGLTVIATPFGAVTPVQVSRLPLSSHHISTNSIPFSFPPQFLFLPHNAVVFGMRTTDGRYAKVQAYRSIPESGALRVQWTTYDTPAPELDIAARWSIAERGAITESITPDCHYCRSAPVRRTGVFEAWPRLMAFPIDYQWCLCGTVLEEGKGTVDSMNGPLAYELTGRRLRIDTEMEQDVDCELCVSAIDARGRELFTCIRLSQSGTWIDCKPCTPRIDPTKFEVLPVDFELQGWRPIAGELRRHLQSA